MHAFLVVGTDQKLLSQQIDGILNKYKSKSVEFPFEKIADVRELARFTKISKNEPITILLRNIDNASQEALNSFLKNLEEPGENITYILTASSEHKVLSTIVSRCRVIYVKSKNRDISKAENFLNNTLGEQFAIIDSIKKRENAIKLIEDIYHFYHRKLIQEDKNSVIYTLLLKEAQRTLNALNANGNIRLQLSRFAIVKDNIS